MIRRMTLSSTSDSTAGSLLTLGLHVLSGQTANPLPIPEGCSGLCFILVQLFGILVMEPGSHQNRHCSQRCSRRGLCFPAVTPRCCHDSSHEKILPAGLQGVVCVCTCSCATVLLPCVPDLGFFLGLAFPCCISRCLTQRCVGACVQRGRVHEGEWGTASVGGSARVFFFLEQTETDTVSSLSARAPACHSSPAFSSHLSQHRETLSEAVLEF